MRKYGVRALSRDVATLLQRHWPAVLVEGEVSQLQTPSSGHAYLVLREQEACLNVVVWRNEWRAATWRPKVGDRVLCRGKLGMYEAQGRIQLYANVLRPAGEGAQQKELAERRARLEAEGLLDPRRKRALPRWPRVIGLATSPTGAALQDFLRVSRERFPSARILLAGCTVQGPEAPSSVVRALELLYEDSRADVIVVTRGGGSKADLLPFWDEQLARWIADAPVPVISAVGHEIDTTLSDLVADAVAPTPSAAAVLALPDGGALAQRVDESVLALQGSALRELARRRRLVDGLAARLRHPGERLAAARRRRDDLARRLLAAMERTLRDGRERTRQADRLDRAMRALLRDRRQRLVADRRALLALSPYAVLDRGYAIVTGPDGVVSDPAQVERGDRLAIRVRAGAFAATVDDDADGGAPSDSR